ncbi:hypothetical protein QTP88_002283 [Uroleucon formosanum]
MESEINVISSSIEVESDWVFSRMKVSTRLEKNPQSGFFNNHLGVEEGDRVLVESRVMRIESTVKYLQDYGLLPCAKQCHKCGSEVKQYQRNDRGKIREVFRCKKKGCQTTQSVRNNNSFFTYENANGRCNSGLSLSEIMEIVYFWVTGNQLVQIIKFTGRSKNTICDWMNLCRDIPVRLFNKRQPFGGPGQIVQIDECLLRGARKNNKGRFRLADLKAAVIPKHEDEEDTNRNYGRRIGGPWVVGLCCVLENGLIDARFFVVEKRDKETLHRIIKNEVLPGTTVHSDSWLGYKGLSEKGYVHETVNHSNNFVDPETGANTQRIESLWRPLRLKVVKKMCGTNEDLLDSPNFFNSDSLYLELFINHYSYFNFNEIQISSEFPSAKSLFNYKHDVDLDTIAIYLKDFPIALLKL